jgi:hypothetical protein
MTGSPPISAEEQRTPASLPAVRARRTRQGNADHLVAEEMRQVIARLRLSEQAVAQLLHGDPEVAGRFRVTDVRRMIAMLVEGDQVPDSATLALLGERLGEMTGQSISVSRLSSRWARVRRAGSTVFAALLAPLCAYLVIGGLLAGQSALMRGRSAVPATIAFVVVLSVLALFEALHISVTQLKTSDLSALRERHPRAVALHREFRTDRGIKRFLAGRQLVVVVTVFFVAGLSSFPAMDVLPWTSTPVPAALRPFLELGAPGALFVLWFAQLAPQFLATQRALRMMDSRVVGVAFRAAMMLESIGFAKPGFWLADWDKTQERIPSSPALRWSQAAVELDGTGVLTMTREWVFDGDGGTLRADTATAFFADGRGAYFDGSITIPAAASALAMSSELRRADGQGSRDLVATSYSEERLASGDRVLQKCAMPAVGSFAPGEVLLTRLAAQFDGTVGRDAVLIDRPARSLAWRATFASEPTCLPPARVTEQRAGDGMTDVLVVSDAVTLEPGVDGEGRLCFEYSVPFPQPGSLYVFEWHTGN